MDIFEQLHGGTLYPAMDERIFQEQTRRLDLLDAYNRTRPGETERRAELLREMLAEIGEGSAIQPPFHANWGGHFLHLGHHVFINYNLSLVDDTHIRVGDCTMIGPNVMIATAGHPVLPELRGERPYQFNMPVHIGKNCWIGGNVSILPGVSIGDHTVIGAGSVVTKDVPSSVIAAGNPCRVLRGIGARDRTFYYRDRAIDWDKLSAHPE